MEAFGHDIALGKSYILSHTYNIYESGTAQNHKSRLAWLQTTYDQEMNVCEGQGPEISLATEGTEQSSSQVTYRAVLLCYTGRVKERQKREERGERVRQEGRGRVTWLQGIVMEMSDRDRSEKQVQQEKLRVLKRVEKLKRVIKMKQGTVLRRIAY